MSGFDFNEEDEFSQEYDSTEDEQQSVEDVVDHLVEQQESNVKIQRTMSEVDRRFDLAQCYRVLLHQDLFSQKTHATQLVQKEVGDFCRERLEALMGMTANVVAPKGQFTEQEMSVLRQLAQAALKRPGLLTKEQPHAAPVLKKAETPTAALTLKPAQAPAPTPTSGLRRQAPKQSVKTAIRQPAVRKKYREIEHPLDAGKTVKIDVTPQVGQGINLHGQPMPDVGVMEMLTQQQAARDSAQTLRRIPQTVQSGVAKILKSEE